MLAKQIITSFFLGLSLVIAAGVSDLAVAEESQTEKTLSEKTYSADEVREDFAELYQRLESAHYNLYVNRTEAEYDQLFKKLRKEVKGTMTESEIRLLFQEFVAFGNIAHARIDLPADKYREYRKQGGKSFPLYIKVMDGKVYIAENYSDHPDVAVGMELLAINGVKVEPLFKRLRRYKSADNDYIFKDRKSVV